MVLPARPLLAVATGWGKSDPNRQVAKGAGPLRRPVRRKHMADDLVELHGRCGRRFAALVAGMGPHQWHNDTPCSQWDVRTLVHHLLSEQRWVPSMFEGLTIEQVGDRFEGDLMAATPRYGRDCWRRRWSRHTRWWRNQQPWSGLYTCPSATPPGGSTSCS
jgi:Mycothiol maleylpyruvate isomerase N-terminal domain